MEPSYVGVSPFARGGVVEKQMTQIDVLVAGGFGDVARQTLRVLLAKKDVRVRALVRDLGEAKWVADAGGELIESGTEHTDILSRALRGVSTLALITPTAERAWEQCARTVRLATLSGVRKVVRLSAIKASESGPTENTRQHGVIERLIRESGMSFVLLRPNYLMQNLLNNVDSVVSQGKLYAGVGDARIGLVDARDVGDSMAVAALSDAFNGSVFELSGPKSVTLSTAAAVIGSAMGRKVEYVAVPPELVGEAVGSIDQDHRSAEEAVAYSRAYAKGLGDFVTNSVEVLNQRPPRSLEQFAREIFAPAAMRVSDRKEEVSLDI